MFQRLIKLFTKKPSPQVSFVDEMFGKFAFDPDLGWKGSIVLAGATVELVIGSDGEEPSKDLLSTAKAWVKEWPLQHQKIIEYIRQELQNWPDEPNRPDPELLAVESINLLWSDSPNTCMIYFTYPGDEIRAWHVTFTGFVPQGFAYDD